MRKTIYILTAALFLGTPGYSQFKGLLNKVKAKVDQRVDKKVDNTIDNTLDKAEGKNTVTATAAPDGASTGEDTKPSLKSFSKYDFVPGEKVLYADDFAQDAIGELPAAWNSNGSGEVVTLDKYAGNWLRLHKATAYLSANQNSFGENYTVEFDMILQLKNNGWMYPAVYFSLVSSKDLSPLDNSLLKEYKQFNSVTALVQPAENNASRTVLESYTENKQFFKSGIVAVAPLQNWYGQPIHVAIQVQKERYRCWINELKAFDVPKGVAATADTMNQLRLEVGGTNYSEETYGVFVGNIKIATGLPDTRHKLIEEGKFSTNGILFDVQSDVIRPESYGVVKEIAGVLKENPSIRVRVIGHTSSDGDDAANLELSKKRAAAVKALLTSEFSIDAGRIDTEGKGETEPIADNKTREGRVQNRRVEFIKL
ncbi:MAG TPA: OmpA family protein [Puia sp.]|nr:OmpA family protein [Puia sp.]